VSSRQKPNESEGGDAAGKSDKTKSEREGKKIRMTHPMGSMVGFGAWGSPEKFNESFLVHVLSFVLYQGERRESRWRLSFLAGFGVRTGS